MMIDANTTREALEESAIMECGIDCFTVALASDAAGDECSEAA
jgi:hypothetical protein